MTLAYRVRVDWDGDDTFGNTLSDVTYDIIRPVVAWRGREYASQSYGRSVAGRLQVTLQNANQRYTNLSQLSALRGLVLPRRKVEFAARADTADPWTPLWTGYIEDVEPVERRSADEVIIYAVGILSELTERLIGTRMETDIRCDAAARIILENAGIPADAIGTLDAPRVIPRWWAGHRPAIEALREIEETEGGALFEDADGRIRMDRAYARIIGQRRHERAIFSDNRAVGSIDIIEPATFRDPSQDIANIVRVRVRRYTAGAETVLWDLSEPVLLNAGTDITLIALYTEGVAAWTVPLVTSTDYVANTMADGSGTDRTDDVTLVATALGAELEITLTNGHATDALYVTALQARGQPLAIGQPDIVLEKHDVSIAKYGDRDYLAASSYLGTIADARDYARYILSQWSEPQRRATITWYAHLDEARALSLNVGDRVSLIARSVPTSMFIESIEHRWNVGYVHTLTMQLSPAEVYASTWVLDVGPGLDSAILGR